MQTQLAPTAPSPSSSSAAEAAPTLYQIPVADLALVVPLVGELMERVAERSDGRYSVGGMLTRFAKGDWQLWIVWDGGAQGSVRAVIGTELYHDISGLKCCTIRFATGRGAARWTHLLADIEAWARSEDCVKLDMIARKGWAKHLPDYALTHVFLEKDLTQ